MSPARAVAILCQGAAMLAGASPAEAVQVWEIVGPQDVPESPREFAALVRKALAVVRGEGQGAGGGPVPAPRD